MNSEKLKKVLNYLVQATGKGQVPWKATTDDEFQVSFGESSITTGWAGDKGGLDIVRLSALGHTPGPYVSIYNRDGVKILTIDTSNIRKFELAEGILREIFMRAKNQVFRYDETFDDIINGLNEEGIG